HPVLAGNRQLRELIENLPSDVELADKNVVSRIAAKLDSVNLLGFALTRTRKRDVHDWRVLREPVDQPISLTSAERAFYDAVTQVVRDYCGKRKGIEGFLLVTPQRQMSSSMPAALAAWR